jgi:TBC1 domain family protein 5
LSVRAKWISLFSHPEITLQDLQGQSKLPSGLGHEEDELGGITLRSVYWRIYLGTLPLESLQSGSSAPLRTHLEAQRRKYDEKREKWLKAPDGRWASDCSVPIDEVQVRRRVSNESGNTTWDPLNLGEEVRRLLMARKGILSTNITLYVVLRRTPGKLGLRTPSYVRR